MATNKSRLVSWQCLFVVFLVLFLCISIFDTQVPVETLPEMKPEEDQMSRLNGQTEQYSPPRLITYTPLGRTGNNLFEYTTLLSIARSTGYTPFVLPSNPLTKYFEIPEIMDVHLTGQVTLTENVSLGCYDARIKLLVDLKHNYTLYGYFHSFRYHDDGALNIESIIKFKPELKRIAQDFIVGKSNEGISNVVIHVRRTDYLWDGMSEEGFIIPNVSYIYRAMDYFKSNVTRDLQFIVVCDDMRWCKEHIVGNDVIYSPFLNPGVDLALMSLCDHVIMTAGTFGWWGGRLSGGHVVYWKGFPWPNSILSRRLNAANFYPSHWTGIW